MRSCKSWAVYPAVITLTLLAIGTAARAQTPPVDPLPDPNQVTVGLIRQDSSDCTNSTVKDDPSRTGGGSIFVTRGGSGSTTVKVGMTVQPNTTYQLFLKCVRKLGDIRTDSDGVGLATFSFPTSLVGSTYAFDMYPDGAPPGNKFQSVTVTFK